MLNFGNIITFFLHFIIYGHYLCTQCESIGNLLMAQADNSQIHCPNYVTVAVSLYGMSWSGAWLICILTKKC